MTRARSEIREALRREVLEPQTCTYCGDRLGPFEVEHVRPVARGGGDERENLACACVACNAQKRTMLLYEWIAWRVTNGMPWPPIASHATEPAHYRDTCSECRRDLDRHVDSFPEPSEPYDLRPHSGGGYVGMYYCDRGHAWKCWWANATWFYSDCPCGFCVAARSESGRWMIG